MSDTARPRERVRPSGARPGEGLRQQAVTGMAMMAGSRLATQFLDQIFTIVLVRLLAPRDFGLLAMASVFTSLLNLFADMGLARAVVQREHLDEEYLSTAFWMNVVSGVLLCGIGLAAAVPVARLYNEPNAGAILAALSARFIFAGGTATHIAVLSRQMRFNWYTTPRIASIIIGGVMGVGLALAGVGAWSLVGQALATYFSNAVFVWAITSWRPRARFSWEKARDLWHFGSPILGARIFSYVIKQFDNFLIGRWLGPVVLGYYAFAYGLFLAPLIDLSLIVSRVALPAFSRLQQDTERLKRGFLETGTYLSLFAFPALIGFFVLTPDLVMVLFGSKWLPAVPVLRLLLVAGVLQSHTGLWQTVMLAMNRPNWVLFWGFLSACVYVPAFLVGLRWGIVGVAAGYLASTVVLVPGQFALVRRLVGFGLRDYLTPLLPLLLASALMVGGMVLVQRLLPGGGLVASLRLGISLAVGAGVYLLAVLLLRRELVTALVRMLRRVRQTPLAELIESPV